MRKYEKVKTKKIYQINYIFYFTKFESNLLI